MTPGPVYRQLDPDQKEAYHKADRQYENKFEEKCALCGERNLWRRIEWANEQNELRKAHGQDAIVIKYCKPCSQKANKAYLDSSNGS